ncbi:hypothetical protein, partial [Paenibacillus sp. KS1]|uniref:hypothetical protein n=1 Tax=Paenibacillus sp. KS1 TaxID=1849249 RepID=UPI001C2F53FF
GKSYGLYAFATFDGKQHLADLLRCEFLYWNNAGDAFPSLLLHSNLIDSTLLQQFFPSPVMSESDSEYFGSSSHDRYDKEVHYAEEEYTFK